MNITTKIKAKIFGFVLGNLRTSSSVFGSLRTSSPVFGSLQKSLNNRELLENSQKLHTPYSKMAAASDDLGRVA